MYTVLIGSYARGTENEHSDIDLVRIGHAEEFELAPAYVLPAGPISYIDYEMKVFQSLYQSGSLFLYHILNEGKLL